MLNIFNAVHHRVCIHDFDIKKQNLLLSATYQALIQYYGRENEGLFTYFCPALYAGSIRRDTAHMVQHFQNEKTKEGIFNQPM